MMAVKNKKQVFAILGEPHELYGASSYAIGAERRDEATYRGYTPDIAHGIVVEFLNGRVSSYAAYWY